MKPSVLESLMNSLISDCKIQESGRGKILTRPQFEPGGYAGDGCLQAAAISLNKEKVHQPEIIITQYVVLEDVSNNCSSPYSFI